MQLCESQGSEVGVNPCGFVAVATPGELGAKNTTKKKSCRVTNLETTT